MLREGEEPAFLETDILVERDAAAVRVEPVRQAVAVRVAHPHQYHAGAGVALDVGIRNAVAVPVAVGNPVPVGVLSEDQQLAGLLQVVVTTVAVQVTEVELTRWPRCPRIGTTWPDVWRHAWPILVVARRQEGVVVTRIPDAVDAVPIVVDG